MAVEPQLLRGCSRSGTEFAAPWKPVGNRDHTGAKQAIQKADMHTGPTELLKRWPFGMVRRGIASRDRSMWVQCWPVGSNMPEILIIDCDDSYRDSLDESIERLGYNAAWVQNLSDGLERLSKRLFEVVLLQSRLPEGQSVDVLPRILEMPSAPEVIIFADSGDPDEAERTYFNRLFTSFVLKSEELDQLRDAARKILGQSKEYQRLIQDLR